MTANKLSRVSLEEEKKFCEKEEKPSEGYILLQALADARNIYRDMKGGCLKGSQNMSVEEMNTHCCVNSSSLAFP